MNVSITGITKEVLHEIIKIFGPESISRCRPYIDFNRLFFDISFIGQCEIVTEHTNVTICKEDKKIIINQGEFSKITIL